MKLRDQALPTDINTLQAMLLAERQLNAEHLADKEQLISKNDLQLSKKDQLIIVDPTVKTVNQQI